MLSMKIKILFLLFCLFFTSFVFAQTTKPKTAEEWYNLGSEKYNAKEYTEAISFLQKSIDLDYKYHNALNELGLCYFQLKNFTKAKEYFRLAILYSEKKATYYSNMSAVFSKINEDEKAYDYARKALEIDETSLTLFNAASMANNIEKPEECLKILDNAIIEKNNDFNDLYARAHLKLKNFDEGIRYFELFFDNYNPETSDINFSISEEKRFYMDYLLYIIQFNLHKEIKPTDEQLKKIESLYKELINNDEVAQKTFSKTLIRAKDILEIDLSYQSFFEILLLSKSSIADADRIEILIALRQYDKIIEFYEPKLNNNFGSEDEFLEDKKKLYIAYLYILKQNIINKKHSPDLENKVINLYEKLNKNKIIEWDIIEETIKFSSSIFSKDPSYKGFITTLFQKTQDEKIKKEIMNLLNEKMK